MQTGFACAPFDFDHIHRSRLFGSGGEGGEQRNHLLLVRDSDVEAVKLGMRFYKGNYFRYVIDFKIHISGADVADGKIISEEFCGEGMAEFPAYKAIKCVIVHDAGCYGHKIKEFRRDGFVYKGKFGHLCGKMCDIMESRYSDIELSYVLPLFFNQKDCGTIINLLRRYASYPPELMKRVMFVLVDDHSTVPVEIPEDINLNIRIYYIEDDIMWNQGGARNLGAYMSPSSKLILSDADHYFPEDLLREIVNDSIPRKLYKFKRANPDGSKKHSAVNILYTSKGIFMNSLGYDEEFCGHYGYEDVMFRFLQKKLHVPLRYFTRRKRIVSTDVDRDNSYHTLVRDTTRNKQLLDAKREAFDSRHPLAVHSRLVLNFRYTLRHERLMHP